MPSGSKISCKLTVLSYDNCYEKWQVARLSGLDRSLRALDRYPGHARFTRTAPTHPSAGMGHLGPGSRGECMVDDPGGAAPPD